MILPFKLDYLTINGNENIGYPFGKRSVWASHFNILTCHKVTTFVRIHVHLHSIPQGKLNLVKVSQGWLLLKPVMSPDLCFSEPPKILRQKAKNNHCGDSNEPPIDRNIWSATYFVPICCDILWWQFVVTFFCDSCVVVADACGTRSSGGSRIFQVGVPTNYFGPFFPKNCMKLKKKIGLR